MISAYGGSYETAEIEFGFTLSKARDNLGHHLIQSFAPGEVSYEEAHRIGKAQAEAAGTGKGSEKIKCMFIRIRNFTPKMEQFAPNL